VLRAARWKCRTQKIDKKVAIWAPSHNFVELYLHVCESMFLLLWPLCEADANIIFTGSIARSASRRYLIYSEADFEVSPRRGDTLHR